MARAPRPNSQPARPPGPTTCTSGGLLRRSTQAELRQEHHAEREHQQRSAQARRKHRHIARGAPARSATGPAHVQLPALVVTNTSGTPGVVAHDTAGCPADSHNGPAAPALHHAHVTGSATSPVTPPVGGDHSPVWLNFGVHDQPVAVAEAVHDPEHGAVWITYQPSLPQAEVAELRAFEARQRPVGGTGSRSVDRSPYLGLPSPIVISAWGCQLCVASPDDACLQRFVDAC